MKLTTTASRLQSAGKPCAIIFETLNEMRWMSIFIGGRMVDRVQVAGIQ